MGDLNFIKLDHEIESYDKRFDKLLSVILKHLGIYRVNVAVVEHNCTRFSTDEINVIGFTQKNAFLQDDYIIYVDPVQIKKVDVNNFLIHECCHIKQYQDGDLRTSKDYHHVWKDKIVDVHTDYFELPHEVDARNMSRKLRRNKSFKREFKKVKIKTKLGIFIRNLFTKDN